MVAWLGQDCIYASDVDRTRSRYEALGLECTSQTDIPGTAHRHGDAALRVGFSEVNPPSRLEAGR